MIEVGPIYIYITSRCKRNGVLCSIAYLHRKEEGNLSQKDIPSYDTCN